MFLSRIQVIFIDADDELLPDALTMLSSVIASHPELPDAVSLMAETCLEDIPNRSYSKNGLLSNFPSGTMTAPGITFLSKLSCTNGNLHSQSWLLACRRVFILQNNLFQPENYTLREDHAWTPQVYFRAKSVAVCSLPSYRYIKRSNSAGRGDSAVALRDVRLSIKDLARFFCQYRSEMPPDVQSFWALHTLNGFFWNFYHPFYRKACNARMVREALAMAFADNAFRHDFAQVEKALSAPKRVASFLIKLEAHGLSFPAELFFKFYYIIKSIPK
ncbi:MAG: hypothetical protein PHI85_02660 [Victivallaceae bacterium]|nr:hypothetical protein [Victivallaceae bacterium]